MITLGILIMSAVLMWMAWFILHFRRLCVSDYRQGLIDRRQWGKLSTASFNKMMIQFWRRLDSF